MGARARGKRRWNYRNGEAGERASEIWLEGKRKAASGFLGVGACRRGRAVATVKLPGKLINNESPRPALWNRAEISKKSLDKLA